MSSKKSSNSGSKTSRKNITPKRRGRRPKKIIDDVEPEPNNKSSSKSELKSNPAVILRLNIDPSKLKNIKSKSNKSNESNESSKSNKTNKLIKSKQKDINSIEQDEESSEGMFKNDIPDDNLCHKCSKNEKTIALLRSKLDKYEKKDKINRTNKIYSNNLNFISTTTGKKITIKKTNTKCWWDAHEFKNLPFFLPELFHNNTYYVMGCFCSLNCALAYNLYYLKDSKIHHRKSLVYKLYHEMYGLSSDDIIDIKESPPKEILESFGGTVPIDTYRRSLNRIDREYIVFMPPVKPISITIEERNTEANNNDDIKEYVLKRPKPLTKKRSVISSMRNKMDDDVD